MISYLCGQIKSVASWRGGRSDSHSGKGYTPGPPQDGWEDSYPSRGSWFFIIILMRLGYNSLRIPVEDLKAGELHRSVGPRKSLF